jgi:hypothetical protein
VTGRRDEALLKLRYALPIQTRQVRMALKCPPVAFEGNLVGEASRADSGRMTS